MGGYFSSVWLERKGKKKKKTEKISRVRERREEEERGTVKRLQSHGMGQRQRTEMGFLRF